MLVWSGRCDSLAGGQPEHAYTDGVGGMAAAGWNHTGRGSMPTQEAKFPVDLCAFHVSLLIVRNSAAEVEEFSRCFCGFSIDEIQAFLAKVLVSSIVRFLALMMIVVILVSFLVCSAVSFCFIFRLRGSFVPFTLHTHYNSTILQVDVMRKSF